MGLASICRCPLRLPWTPKVGAQICALSPKCRLASSKTNQLIPADGASLIMLGSRPCRDRQHPNLTAGAGRQRRLWRTVWGFSMASATEQEIKLGVSRLTPASITLTTGGTGHACTLAASHQPGQQAVRPLSRVPERQWHWRHSAGGQAKALAQQGPSRACTVSACGGFQRVRLPYTSPARPHSCRCVSARRSCPCTLRACLLCPVPAGREQRRCSKLHVTLMDT